MRPELEAKILTAIKEMEKVPLKISLFRIILELESIFIHKYLLTFNPQITY